MTFIIYIIVLINQAKKMSRSMSKTELLKIIEDQGKGNLIKALFIDENMEYMGGTETVKIIGLGIRYSLSIMTLQASLL